MTWDLVFISLVLVTVSAYVVTYMLSVERVVLYEIWVAIWGSLICFGILSWMFWREYERVID
jgi:hypothetical protein